MQLLTVVGHPGVAAALANTPTGMAEGALAGTVHLRGGGGATAATPTISIMLQALPPMVDSPIHVAKSA
jgi:hypothetical protein